MLVQRKALIFGYLKDLNFGNLTNLKKGQMQKLLNKHMVNKRLWEPTDEDIERDTKRRSRRYAKSASVIRKKPKKRKLSQANLSDYECVAGKPVLRKRRKTNLAGALDDS